MNTVAESPLVIPEEHTPGPWITSHGYVPALKRKALGVLRESHQPGTNGVAICVVATEKDLEPHDEANARLIAAAPELLEALDHLAAFTGAVFEKHHIREDFQMTVGLKEGGEPRKTSFADVALRVATALCKARGIELPAPSNP